MFIELPAANQMDSCPSPLIDISSEKVRKRIYTSDERMQD